MKEALFAQTSCIILSAGSSARMGTHKALLKFDSERTFIQKVSETYLLTGIEQIIIVLNAELFNQLKERNLTFDDKVILVINEKPELGRFYSLRKGVQHLTPGNYCFLQNIDNPFISAEVINPLIKHRDEADVIVPTFQKRSGHPVLICPFVAREILLSESNDLRIDLFFKRFEVKKVETSDHNILVNINSPEDYTNWIKHIDKMT